MNETRDLGEAERDLGEPIFSELRRNSIFTEVMVIVSLIINCYIIDPSGPVVPILATGSEVRGFKPGRGRWIFSERKNSENDFLRKGSKAVGPVS